MPGIRKYVLGAAVAVSDLSQHDVHGPVRTLRREHAVWDVERGEWQAPDGETILAFLPDGHLESLVFQNADGTTATRRFVYDEAGRLIETTFQAGSGAPHRTVQFYDAEGRHARTVSIAVDGAEREMERSEYDGDGRRILVRPVDGTSNTLYAVDPGTKQAYGAPGAVSMRVRHDASGLPAQAEFLDQAGEVLREVNFTRDESGRVLREEMQIRGDAGFRQMLESAAPERREALRAALPAVFGGSTATFAYDGSGRMVEKTTQFGGLANERCRYEYSPGVVLSIRESSRLDAKVEDGGNIAYMDKGSLRQENRTELVYDSRGNWTETRHLQRYEPNPDFLPASLERREIVYYEEWRARRTLDTQARRG